MEIIFIFLILIYSIILHEISHGYVAYKLGDPTAKYEGRLSLNPIPHIDPIGTILLPALTFLTSGFIFGWAKPVPYNPYNLKNPNRDSIYIALAGPLTNICLAIIFSFLYKFFPLQAFLFGLRINLVLAFFNLLPIPPLDGSKILLTKIPLEIYQYLEIYGFILIIIFMIFFFPYFSNFINLLQNFLIRI
ncbi:MAG: site-2 protease family protein [Candidatus Parcubacteria bacterium]|nr:MAG: site-2 protease family protein [Candidatus Parcubacteria bacterium]